MLAFRRLVSRFVVGGTLLAGVARAEDPVAPSARWQGADAPYLKKAGEPIHRRWQGFVRELARMPAGSPYGNAGLEVDVALTVEPDGTISRVHPEKQSGLKGFDDAPLELLKDVRQLPPPPSMLASDDGKTHLLWRFRRSEPDLDEGVVVEARLPLAEALPRLVAAGATDRAIARVAEAWRPGSEGEALLGKLAAALADGGATSGDPVVRVAAVRVLAHLDGSDARLLQLAADPDASVRRAALGALGGKRGCAKCRDTLMTALAGDDRAAAAAALGELGDKAAAPELEKLLAAGKAAPESARGLAALGDRGKAVAATRKLLAGDAAQKRAGALAAAGIVDAELLAPLQSAMAGGSESLKIEILDELALAPKTSRAEVHKLLVRALSDVSPRVRARAVELLVADGDKGVKGRLVDLLGDADAGVRAVAAAALVRVAGASSLDELARAARDKSPQVRAALAAALVVHPVEGAGKLAAKLDGDGDPQVHKALAAAREQAKTRGAAPSRDQLADRLLHTTNLYDGLRAAADWLASPSLRADAKSR